MKGLCCWRSKEEKKYEDIMENTETLRHSSSRRSNVLQNESFNMAPAILEEPATPLAAPRDQADNAEFGPSRALFSASHRLAEPADRSGLAGGVEHFLASPGSNDPPGPTSPTAADWSGLERGRLNEAQGSTTPDPAPPAGGLSPSPLTLHTATEYRSLPRRPCPVGPPAPCVGLSWRHVTEPEDEAPADHLANSSASQSRIQKADEGDSPSSAHDQFFPANFESAPSDHRGEADASPVTADSPAASEGEGRAKTDRSVLASAATTPPCHQGEGTLASPSTASIASSVGSSLDIKVDNIKVAALTSPRGQSMASPDPQGAIAQELETLWQQEAEPGQEERPRFPHVASLAFLRAAPASPAVSLPSPALSD